MNICQRRTFPLGERFPPSRSSFLRHLAERSGVFFSVRVFVQMVGSRDAAACLGLTNEIRRDSDAAVRPNNPPNRGLGGAGGSAAAHMSHHVCGSALMLGFFGQKKKSLACFKKTETARCGELISLVFNCLGKYINTLHSTADT